MIELNQTTHHSTSTQQYYQYVTYFSYYITSTLDYSFYILCIDFYFHVS
jgi:hypothetical protein